MNTSINLIKVTTVGGKTRIINLNHVSALLERDKNETRIIYTDEDQSDIIEMPISEVEQKIAAIQGVKIIEF